MSKELLEALEQIGRGRNIDRKLLVKALEFAINTASKKALGVENAIRVELDEDSGTTAIDSTGNGHSGTCSGPVWAPSQRRKDWAGV